MKKILGLDYGSKRVGLALGNDQAKLASPAGIVANDQQLHGELSKIIKQEEIDTIVVGLPRGLDGQETAASWAIRRFAGGLADKYDTEVILQDEAMTTQVAQKRLGKSKDKQFVDAAAAAIILQDYLDTLS